MLGAEPNLEIMGVLLVPGRNLPDELSRHLQFDYMQKKKLDWKNPADKELIRGFMSAEDGEGNVKNLAVNTVLWVK